MDHHVYQLIALGARYLFVVLAFLIVFRAGLSLLSEHRRRKKTLRNLPDAGMVGEMRDADSDRAYPLPREGTLGSGRGCDIRLKGLRRRHVNFSFVEGKGLLLTPCHSRSDILLNNAPIGKGGYALHGALMRAGGYTLRIRLFAGLNVPRAAQYADHWQPAFGEELYAPDPNAQEYYAPEPYEPYYEAPPRNEPYCIYPPREDDDAAPLPPGGYPPAYGYMPPPVSPPPPVLPEEEDEDDTPPPFDTGLYAPKSPQEEDLLLGTPRIRHRRSERNKHL